MAEQKLRRFNKGLPSSDTGHHRTKRRQERIHYRWIQNKQQKLLAYLQRST